MSGGIASALGALPMTHHNNMNEALPTIEAIDLRTVNGGLDSGVTGGAQQYTDEQYMNFANAKCFGGDPYACEAGKTILTSKELWHANDPNALQAANGAKAYLRQTMP
jgi:hypothetical protein